MPSLKNNQLHLESSNEGDIQTACCCEPGYIFVIAFPESDGTQQGSLCVSHLSAAPATHGRHTNRITRQAERSQPRWGTGGPPPSLPVPLPPSAITRSFILQLCAKDLEPSIFSQCLFFMKARGRFQSVRSDSSSSPSPRRGDCSSSDSIEARAPGTEGAAAPGPARGGRRAAEWAEDGQGQRAAPRSAELPAGPGPPLAPLAPRAPRSLRREPRPAHSGSALPRAPAGRERIGERRGRSGQRRAEGRSDPRRRQRDSPQQRSQEAAIFPGPQCTALRSAAWDKRRRAGPTAVAMVTAEAAPRGRPEPCPASGGAVGGRVVRLCSPPRRQRPRRCFSIHLPQMKVH